jgi:hypothetical protein
MCFLIKNIIIAEFSIVFDPVAGSSKRRSRAGGVSGFGNEDVEMNNI